MSTPICASSSLPLPEEELSLIQQDCREKIVARQERHTFQTKFSLLLTVVTLSCFVLLSVLYGGSVNGNGQGKNHILEKSTMHQLQQSREFQKFRWLEQDISDFSDYSCNDIYSEIPERGEKQCQYAKTCNGGSGVWSKWAFCTQSFSMLACLAMLLPIIVIWLVILFRLLGSTAEEYFSPALEMLAVKLGLPPRFAGVTLLALGNGAADVSATVSAITNDPQSGYLLSLGALTGAAMIIATVISASVILVAGGVPCRGALVRDVAALGIAVLIVWQQLGGGTNKGRKVGPETVTLFFGLYAVFVLVVLLADIYHRAVVVPRQVARRQEAERRRQLQDQVLHEQEVMQQERQEHKLQADDADALASLEMPPTTAPGISGDGGSGSARPPSQDGISMSTTNNPASPERGFRRGFSNVLTAFSNYDNPDDDGVESEELPDRPILLHGAHGILNKHRLHDHHGNREGLTRLDEHPVEDSAYAAMLDPVLGDGACAPSVGVDRSWSEACKHAIHEVQCHASETWDDIAYNGDLDLVTKMLLILEIPFIVLRKLTVPIPCEGFYVRGLVALSLALSPLWMAHYLFKSHDHVVFDSWAFWTYWGLVLVVALCFMRYAPTGDDPDLSLWISTPIALYGFAIAATWIDKIADALVNLLDFIGIVLRIPGPIVGLTILAWGNSMSDLSANITMARKGLANMAMTACFAGPFFNILVGLGLGFSRLAHVTGVHERQIQMESSISAGFWFLAINSVVMLVAGFWWNGTIPKKYGFVALALYSVYLVYSIVMEYA